MYLPLWVKSNYSFLEGASHPEELVEKAWKLGLPSIALTDRDGVYGIVRAHVKAKELGIHLVIGSEVTISDPSPLTPHPSRPPSIVLLVQNREGYRNLCRLITTGRCRHEKGSSSVTWQEVAAHGDGLIALAGPSVSCCADSKDVTDLLKESFGGRLYAMLPRHRQAQEVKAEQQIRRWAEGAGIPRVAASEVLYHNPARRPLQDVLTAIRHGVSVPDAGRRLRSNAEHDLKASGSFEALFVDEPVLVERTREIAARCDFSLSELCYRYPAEPGSDEKNAAEQLRRLTDEGAWRRFPQGVPESIRRQIERELDLIEELDYVGYFLTMREIIAFCGREGILCQGRGSAANSAVCYCLGITAVDPTRVELLFERFLSRERAEPPDIDLDIMHERREEVIRFVYDRYGRDRAAMVANVVRYRARSAVRDVGKALGISETAIDRLARFLSSRDQLDSTTLRQMDFNPEDPLFEHFLGLFNEIQGFPRHLSIHPGGFLLGHEPVHDLVPIENGSMAGRTVIQWDKEDLEDLGLFKVDLLGLGALSQLDRGFRLLRNHYGRDLSMNTIPEDDAATFEMIGRADTVGVFQIESRAQMAMLPRLKPRSFYDLVIEVSIVRPGPITGGMVHPYLRRRNAEEPVIYPHPSLEPVLKKTLGVPLFQEQVMRLAVVAADYTPGEADQLRRDMAAWRKTGRIEAHRDRLVSRMTKKGIAKEFAEQVFDQIRGFGEYGFPESHAASFALIAYATAWLRRHVPDVFVCSLLNAQPMGFYTPATIVDDAKRHGVEVRSVDVRMSQWDCTLEKAACSSQPTADSQKRAVSSPLTPHSSPSAPLYALRMGLRYVKGLSRPRDGRAIEEARRVRPFSSLEDFAFRTRLDEGVLCRLAEAGALKGLEADRRTVLWQVQGVTKRRAETLPVPTEKDSADFKRLDAFETIAWDYENTGHSIAGHPLTPFRSALSARGLPDAQKVRNLPHNARTHYAGLVICRQRPGTASGVTFMTLEDETGFVNVILWKRLFDRYRTLVKTASFLGVTGTVQSEKGVVHLVADRLWLPQGKARPRTAGSRDFH